MLKAFGFFCRGALALLCGLATSLGAQTEAAMHRAAIEGMYPVMLNALQTKNYGRARNICEQAILWEPQNPVHHYNLACIDAQSGGSRLPYAWGSLELAIALGFNDPNHLRTDPDLAPLRDDPRFAALVRKLIYNVSAGAAIASVTFPAPTDKPQSETAPSADNDQPEPAAAATGGPVGLYLMTKYLPLTQSLERSVWYFTPDQRVYRGLENGISKTDLAAHRGARGTVRSAGSDLEITWSAGEPAHGELERDGDGFTWDMGLFTPVTAFQNSEEVPGVYEGAEAVGISSQAVPVMQRLELEPDGTFRWEGVSFTRAVSGHVELSSASESVTTGRWRLSGFSLVLTSTDGLRLRKIAFPQDDEGTIIRPDRMYFSGLLYKRRP